jgi:large subunit ribosomal protein L29
VKYSEIKDLTVEELRKRLKSIREELFESKMKMSLGQLANPLAVRGLRRDLARIQTAITSKLAR